MGLVGSGTNNARLAQMLRQLAVYYQKDANALFMVRQAQGLVHLGKGTLTMNPFHSDKSLINVAAASALISAVVTCLDSRALILGKHHYLLYSIVPCIQVIHIFEPFQYFTFNSASFVGLSRRRVSSAASFGSCRSGGGRRRSSRKAENNYRIPD